MTIAAAMSKESKDRKCVTCRMDGNVAVWKPVVEERETRDNEFNATPRPGVC